MALVFYFSGTGNSLSVAKALSDTPVNIATAKAGTYKADSIGFVFPVYCSNMPEIVSEFVKNSTFEAPYIWAVPTYGGSAGHSAYVLHRLLKKSGGLSYAAGIILPDSVIMYKTPAPLKEKYLSSQNAKIEKIKAEIEIKTIRKPCYIPFAKLAEKASWWFLKDVLKIKHKKAGDNCNMCKTCIMLCPEHNIKDEGGRAVFGDKCQNCFGCIQYCPKNAITFGKLKREEESKYTHPSINAAEMIKRNEN